MWVTLNRATKTTQNVAGYLGGVVEGSGCPWTSIPSVLSERDTLLGCEQGNIGTAIQPRFECRPLRDTVDHGVWIALKSSSLRVLAVVGGRLWEGVSFSTGLCSAYDQPSHHSHISHALFHHAYFLIFGRRYGMATSTLMRQGVASSTTWLSATTALRGRHR